MPSRPTRTDRPELWYVECDGVVYLVEGEDGRLTLPTAEQVPFEVERRDEMEFEEARVVYCTPHLEGYPEHWTHKDAVPGMENVDPLVRRAVNATLIREVAGAVILRGDEPDVRRRETLLVKASRGFTEGLWNVPGGFLTYGETPEVSLVREVAEETGLDIAVGELLGVYSKRFGGTYYMRAFIYAANVTGGALELDPSEIAEARWFPLEKAVDVIANPFGLAGMEVLLKRAEGALN